MHMDVFRAQVRSYSRVAGKSQKLLAAALNLNPVVLSQKLNGTNKATLTNLEVKEIVKKLVEWEAISSYEDARYLLGLMDLSFTPQEWHTFPLNQLAGSSDVEAFSPKYTLTHNIPAPLTQLVGREHEVANIQNLLQSKRVRLLTITGPGGVGKTRLSIEVGWNLLPKFEHGVFLVELASIIDPALVVSVISQILGLKEKPGQSQLDNLKSFFADHELLLILDNFEHLRDAASLLKELLQAAPALKILVTSRTVLHLYGEREFIVPPLSLPDLKHLPPLEELVEYEAVELFVERVQAARINFMLTAENAPAVAEICVRLDGLPLAIELAASRCKLFSPQQMLVLLGKRFKLLENSASNLPRRQQSLQHAIDWSYELLSASEQELFEKLAVFKGGCTLEAAATVFQQSPSIVLNQIASLIDNSLIIQDKAGYTDSQVESEPSDQALRFTMLEIIREYALEKIAHKDSNALSALQKEYASYFLDLAETAELELRGTNQTTWLARLAQENDNFRAALTWMTELPPGERPPQEIALRLGGALGRFWATHGHLSEGRRWLTLILSRFTRPSNAASLELDVEELVQAALTSGWPVAAIAKALQMNGLLALRQADHWHSQESYQSALLLYKRLNSKAGQADSLRGLGVVYHSDSEFKKGRACYEESLAVYREIDDLAGQADILNNLAILAQQVQEDYATARKLFQESLSIRQCLGDERSIADSLHNLSTWENARGNYSQAMLLESQAIELYRKIGYQQGLAWALQEVGGLLLRQSEFEQAKLALQESLALNQELGSQRYTAQVLNSLGGLAVVEKDIAQADLLYKEALAISKELNSKDNIATSYYYLGKLACKQGQLNQAKLFFTQSLELYRKIELVPAYNWLVHGYALLLFFKRDFTNAIKLFGAAQAEMERQGTDLSFFELLELDGIKSEVMLTMTSEEFNLTWAEGKVMSVEQALAYASSKIPDVES